MEMRFSGAPCARVQKVQKVVAASSGRVQRVWYRRFAAMKFYNSASQNGKPYNRAAPDGNAPLSPPAAVLPPKGETTHYILRVASLLQNVFAVHPGGGSYNSYMLCATYEVIS